MTREFDLEGLHASVSKLILKTGSDLLHAGIKGMSGEESWI